MREEEKGKAVDAKPRLRWRVQWENPLPNGRVAMQQTYVEAEDSQRALSKALRQLLHDHRSFRITDFRLAQPGE